MNQQEIEILKRKLNRAKRIARIKRKKRINNYIKNRVYIIILLFIITLISLIITIKQYNKQTDDIILLHQTMNELLARTTSDKLLKTNLKLIGKIDSLEQLIFVYNRRHQSDQQTINYLLNINYKTCNHEKDSIIIDNSINASDTCSN